MKKIKKLIQHVDAEIFQHVHAQTLTQTYRSDIIQIRYTLCRFSENFKRNGYKMERGECLTHHNLYNYLFGHITWDSCQNKDCRVI